MGIPTNFYSILLCELQNIGKIDNVDLEREIQNTFLELLKSKIPLNHSLVAEISETLQLSTDSVYRRIRGETLLTFHEIVLLSKRFNISLDSLVGENNYSINFDYYPIDNERLTIKKFIEMMRNDFDEASKVDYVEVIYLARDMPIFYLFKFPEICAFKIHFWNLLYQDPNQKAEKFDLDIIDGASIDLCKYVWEAFVKVPSIEIWGVPTFDAILDEIDFMWEGYLIKNKDQALLLCEKVSELLNHVRRQAQLGYKFSENVEPEIKENNFQMYYSDFQLTHNKIMINGDIKRVYISQSLDTIITSDLSFFDRNYHSILNVLKRSMLISKVGEKERNKLMSKCQKKIDALKSKIISSED